MFFRKTSKMAWIWVDITSLVKPILHYEFTLFPTPCETLEHGHNDIELRAGDTDHDVTPAETNEI